MPSNKMVYQWQLEDKEATVQEPLIARQALHAHTLEIKHPVSGEKMKFQAPLPEDMQRLIEKLREFRSL